MLHKIANPTNRCSLKFDNDSGTFEGYASVFHSNDLVNDTIHPGAFEKAAGRTLPLFINHDHGAIPVGAFTGKEDDHGFVINGEINLNHKDGPSAHSAMKLGHMNGLSIGFGMDKDGFAEKSDGGRDIYMLTLKETSIVTFPCEPLAGITAVKSLDELQTVKDFERWLRDEFNVSKKMACKILSHFKRLNTGDPVKPGEEIKSLTDRLARQDALAALSKRLERY